MDNPAGLSDLKSRGYCRDLTVGQTRLDEAWRALLDEVPTIPASVAAGLLNPKSVADVVAGAAMRVLRNTDGVEEETKAIDDYRESTKRADPTMDVYFTTAELRRMNKMPAPTAGSVTYR